MCVCKCVRKAAHLRQPSRCVAAWPFQRWELWISRFLPQKPRLRTRVGLFGATEHSRHSRAGTHRAESESDQKEHDLRRCFHKAGEARRLLHEKLSRGQGSSKPFPWPAVFVSKGKALERSTVSPARYSSVTLWLINLGPSWLVANRQQRAGHAPTTGVVSCVLLCYQHHSLFHIYVASLLGLKPRAGNWRGWALCRGQTRL